MDWYLIAAGIDAFAALIAVVSSIPKKGPDQESTGTGLTG
jgi:hypothetical protein